MPKRASNAPVGTDVIGSSHAESAANPKRSNRIAVVDPAEKQASAQPSLDEAPSSLRVADGILRSLKGGKPVALGG